MWYPRRPAATLVFISLVVHAALLGYTAHRTGRIDAYAFHSLDAGEYDQLARNLARHGVFSRGEHPPLKPDTWRTPGYPLFLATVLRLVGDSPTRLIGAQQLLSILNVWLLFGIARSMMSERRAMTVALLFLVEPYHLWYSLWLIAATFFLTLLLLIWSLWLRVLRGKGHCSQSSGTQNNGTRWLSTLLLGGLVGFAVLVRPIALLVPIVLLAGLSIESYLLSRQRSLAPSTTTDAGSKAKRNPSIRSMLVLPVLFTIPCMLVVGGWMARNHRVAGHFALSDQGGVVLAYFKATEVVLWNQGRTAERYIETTLDPSKRNQPHPIWETIDERLRKRLATLPEPARRSLRWQNLAQGNRSAVDSFTVSQALSEIGRSMLLATPLSTAACCLVRCGSILTFPLNLGLSPPKGLNASRFSWLAKGTLYLVLLLAVLVRLARGGLGFTCIYYPLACTVALLIASTPQYDPRFRVPMIPLLLVVALVPHPVSLLTTNHKAVP